MFFFSVEFRSTEIQTNQQFGPWMKHNIRYATCEHQGKGTIILLHLALEPYHWLRCSHWHWCVRVPDQPLQDSKQALGYQLGDWLICHKTFADQTTYAELLASCILTLFIWPFPVLLFLFPKNTNVHFQLKNLGCKDSCFFGNNVFIQNRKHNGHWHLKNSLHDRIVGKYVWPTVWKCRMCMLLQKKKYKITKILLMNIWAYRPFLSCFETVNIFLAYDQ